MKKKQRRRPRKTARQSAKTGAKTSAGTQTQTQTAKTRKSYTAQEALDVALEHHRAGRLSEAERIYKQILRAQPDNAAACNNLGVALKTQGMLDEAIVWYRRAQKISPDYAEAINNLGNALKEQEKLDEALVCFRRAVEIKPDYADARNSLGALLNKQGHVDEAIACYRRALKDKPDDETAHNNLGVILKTQGKVDEAIAFYHRALELKPDYAEAQNNLGNAVKDLGNLEDAFTRYRRAMEIDPDYASAHFNYSLALLLGGKYAEGWVEHEWRWKRDDPEHCGRGFAQPLWDGSRLDGRTILVHAEQGLGDAIQFIRYMPFVAERGGRVVVECHPMVIRLFKDSPGIDQWVKRESPLPHFDVQTPFLTLPMIFGTTVETIPAEARYLRAEPGLVGFWRRRMAGFAGMKIGLCWQGNPNFPGDPWRSIPLKHFAVLLDRPSTTFINLHKGAGEGQIEEYGLADRIVNYSPEVKSLIDTAAIMENLDLIITSDTSVAHLAGALGKPTWVVLQFVPDWRWHLDRDDNPWYPTMRLFRQKTLGDWDEVFVRVKRALDEYGAP